MTPFGPLIKQARLERRLSQRALAEKLGINFTYLSKLEGGDMPPPSEELIEKLVLTLELDRDGVFQAAAKLPQDLTEIALQPGVPLLLRAAKGMTPQELESLTKQLIKNR